MMVGLAGKNGWVRKSKYSKTATDLICWDSTK